MIANIEIAAAMNGFFIGCVLLFYVLFGICFSEIRIANQEERFHGFVLQFWGVAYIFVRLGAEICKPAVDVI